MKLRGMTLRVAGRWLAAVMSAAFAALIFKAWLDPQNLSLWLSGWIGGLCT